MQIVLYTAPTEIDNEIEIISTLFENGIDYLYLRKPELDDFSLVDFVEQIPEKYWSKCIATSLIITKEFDLAGYHFTQESLQKNTNYNQKILEWLHGNNKISSASAHSIEELNRHAGQFKHVMVAPLFPSISKENHFYNWDFETLSKQIATHKSQNTTSRFFAVGGVDATKINEIQTLNFDGIGLLGAIWNSPANATENFNNLLQNIHHGK